jgi:hypothetical protein
MNSTGLRHKLSSGLAALTTLALLLFAAATSAQEAKIGKTDTQIDALDPGIKLFLREKMIEGNNRSTEEAF